MKAKVNDKIITIINMKSEFSDRLIPSGTEGIVIECFDNPEMYYVDLMIPENDLVGDFSWENLSLTPEQFTVT